MQAKKFLIFVFSCFVFIAGGVGAVNYVVDPYGYNNTIVIERFNAKKYSNTSMTTRFKANLLANKNFESIMLGTSRIGVMDPTFIDKKLGTKTFNLEYPGSNTEIQHKLFKYAYHYNKELKYLIYGIDFMSFNQNRTTKHDFIEFYDLQQNIEDFDKIDNYELYFNIETLTKSIKLVIKNILNLQKIEEKYLVCNGMRDYLNYIQDNKTGSLKLDENIQNSIKSYFKENGTYKRYTFSDQFFEYFKETIQFCDQNNIKVYVYIPPMLSDTSMQ